MKKPVLVSLVLFNHPLKALMLEASTTLWSSRFHLLITLFDILISFLAVYWFCFMVLVAYV